MTLLGEYEGNIYVAGSKNDLLRLQVPPFPGWEPDLYEHIAFGPGRDFTVRWPQNHAVKLWIEQYTKRSTEAVEQAVLDWQGLLNDAITFVRVDSPGVADMTVRFVPSFLLPGEGTVGTCTRWYTRSTGLMLRGEIEIARSWADRVSLHRHEIGHCIGLGHSPVGDHLMYPILYNDTATVTERDMARLLYALPPKSPRLQTHADWEAEAGLGVRPPMSSFPSADDVVIEIVR